MIPSIRLVATFVKDVVSSRNEGRLAAGDISLDSTS